MDLNINKIPIWNRILWRTIKIGSKMKTVNKCKHFIRRFIKEKKKEERNTIHKKSVPNPNNS
jgi:hypothetical protein